MMSGTFPALQFFSSITLNFGCHSSFFSLSLAAQLLPRGTKLKCSSRSPAAIANICTACVLEAAPRKLITPLLIQSHANTMALGVNRESN